MMCSIYNKMSHLANFASEKSPDLVYSCELYKSVWLCSCFYWKERDFRERRRRDREGTAKRDDTGGFGAFPYTRRACFLAHGSTAGSSTPAPGLLALASICSPDTADMPANTHTEINMHCNMWTHRL